MIQNSFIFLDRVSEATEKKIWSQGVHTWDQFLENKIVPGVAPSRKSFFDMQLRNAQNHLKNDDEKYFAEVFPNSEVWRLYNQFKDDALFLDIETTGFRGSITVIGIYDGNDTNLLVKGFNLDKKNLQKAVEGSKMIVTFNGRCFDIPVINKYFGGIMPDVPHLDLRFAFSKLGLRGGLKHIEKELNVKRDDSVEEMSGADAVYMWRKWEKTGNREYLDLLLKYNEEDIVNLKPLSEYVVKNLKQEALKNFNVSSNL